MAVLEARALEWPEFHVHEGLIRIYPYGRTAAHAFGHMGEVREEQLEEPAFRGYQSGDVVGQSGVEARYESYLRGHDGYRLRRVEVHPVYVQHDLSVVPAAGV